jgi:YggT family protein
LPQIAELLIGLLDIFRLVLLGRIILDWVRVMNPNFRPKGLVLILSELAYTLTDWAIKPISKVLKPIRMGGGYLDLSVLALFVVLIVLEALLRTIV